MHTGFPLLYTVTLVSAFKVYILHNLQIYIQPTMSLKKGKQLIGADVVVPIDTLKREAKKIANTKDEQNKKLGEDFVPDAMKEGKPLRGKIIGYNEETRKYQVKIDKIAFPLYFSRNDIIVAKLGDKKDMEYLKVIEEYNANCDTDSDEDVVQQPVTDTETKMKFKF